MSLRGRFSKQIERMDGANQKFMSWWKIFGMSSGNIDGRKIFL